MTKAERAIEKMMEEEALRVQKEMVEEERGLEDSKQEEREEERELEDREEEREGHEDREDEVVDEVKDNEDRREITARTI